MSHNLRVALGLATAGEVATAETGGGGDGNGDWRPPSFAGLDNSKPLTTLMPLVIGQQKGLEIEYKKKMGEGEAEGGEGGDGDEEWSEEEGWDYEGKLLVLLKSLKNVVLQLFLILIATLIYLHLELVCTL